MKALEIIVIAVVVFSAMAITGQASYTDAVVNEQVMKESQQQRQLDAILLELSIDNAIAEIVSEQ